LDALLDVEFVVAGTGAVGLGGILAPSIIVVGKLGLRWEKEALASEADFRGAEIFVSCENKYIDIPQDLSVDHRRPAEKS
jgi:hypothetical protein